MNQQQFEESTEAAEMMLNALADSIHADANWSQAWIEWFAGTFILRIIYPPGTKKAKLKWLLSARRSLCKDTKGRWLFCVYRMQPLTDRDICFKYSELVAAHGGGMTLNDLDEGEESL